MSEPLAREKHPHHHEAWALIPWYVNGTLAASERLVVEAHCDNCNACAQELNAQRRLAEVVAETSDLSASEGRQWEVLRDRISGDMPGKSLSSAKRQRVQSWTNWWLPTAGIAAAAIGAFMIVALPQNAGPDFRTLTDSETTEGSVIRLTVEDGVSEAQLAAILNEIGLSISSSRSPSGVYTIVVPNPETLDDMVDRLNALPEIDVVTGRVNQ